MAHAATSFVNPQSAVPAASTPAAVPSARDSASSATVSIKSGNLCLCHPKEGRGSSMKRLEKRAIFPPAENGAEPQSTMFKNRPGDPTAQHETLQNTQIHLLGSVSTASAAFRPTSTAASTASVPSSTARSTRPGSSRVAVTTSCKRSGAPASTSWAVFTVA